MKQYAVYLRKSRADVEAESRGEMETLKRHERALLELARKSNYAIIEIYREIVSGDTIAARPAMRRLLDEVRDGRWAGVLVMDIERLARGETIDQGIVAQAFTLSNTLIITPTKTYDPNDEFDQEYFEFGLFMARREYKVINRRLQRGRIASVKEGKHLGTRPPYGYRRVRLENRPGFSLESDGEQAPILKMMFELYTRPDDRMGATKIASYLNALGIPSALGGKWSCSVVCNILRNPVYAGKIRWNWRPKTKRVRNGGVEVVRERTSPEEWILVDGLHDPLIDDETWQRAQRLLSDNRPAPIPRGGKLMNSLAGIAVCGLCGAGMRRKPKGPKLVRDVLICPNPECGNVSSYLDVVEGQIIAALAQWMKGYEVSAKTAAVSERGPSAELKRAQNERATLSAQLSKLHDLLEQGVYSTEVFQERLRTLGERIAASDKIMDDMRKEREERARRRESEQDFVPVAENIMAVYSQTDDPAERNTFLKRVLRYVVYTKNKAARKGHGPYDFNIELVPMLENRCGSSNDML